MPGTSQAGTSASPASPSLSTPAPASTPAAAMGAGELGPLYARIRATTEALCRPLRTEDYVVQSMPDASPTKWHLAHTSWFFETFVLARAAPDYRAFDERLALLFNSYYHAAGERHPRPERGLLTRPTVEEVYAYRAHVDVAMRALLSGERGTVGGELAFLIELGLNHEEQHQELLLTDIQHALALNPLEPAYRERSLPVLGALPEREAWVPFEGGLVELGTDASGFAFDNERPRHRRFLEPFELARAPVTCGEWLEFMAAGGYRRSEHWLSDGWDVCTRLGWEAPLYWKRAGQKPSAWRVLTLNGARPLDEREPVCHVSYYEAEAFARWKGARLPLEEEWEHAAADEPLQGNLLDGDRLHPAPPAQAGRRLDQAFGDVWEWTASAYSPYPGFQPFQGAIGEYNGKWMSSRYVLRGGSCLTPARHIRRSYRNFFGPEARWQVSGLRLARSPR
jgi:ergothioneine biosynthesis protein EgtB